MRARWCRLVLPGLTVAMALALLPVAATSAVATGAPTRTVHVAAMHPPTIVSGYVQSGGPLAGARVRIYVPGRDQPVLTTRTTKYGYFLAELPALPTRLRVEATGGRGPAGWFDGTMIGVTVHPTTRDSFYVNPVTTLVSTYLDSHPHATHADATAKVRGLLGLKRYHNVTWALGVRPSYFDGVKFLRTAKRHGGFDAYVAGLVAGIDDAGPKVTFRRKVRETPEAPSAGKAPSSAIAGLIGEEAAGYLGIASQGASIVSVGLGVMNVVGQLVGWSPGGATPAQILGAIAQVQSTLTGIQQQLTNLASDMKGDFQTLQVSVEDDGYDDSVAPVIAAFGQVTKTQGHYVDVVNDQYLLACTPPPPTASTRDVAQTEPACTADNQAAAQKSITADLANYQNDISDLEDDLGGSVDVFRDAVLPDLSNTPALTWLVDKYLNENDQVFLPAGTTLAKDFTARVLTNQALAYYLITEYERGAHPWTPTPGGTIDLVSTNYLGPGYATWPQYTSPDGPPTTPTSAPDCPASEPDCDQGNLHDMMSYLQSILPVPDGMAIDAKQGGLMYATSGNVEMAYYLPVDEQSRAICGFVKAYNTGYRDYPDDVPGGGSDSEVCSVLADALLRFLAYVNGFADLQGRMILTSLSGSEPAGTYWSGVGTGWTIVTQGQLVTALQLLSPLGFGDPYYYDPGPLWFSGGNTYTVDHDTSFVCADGPIQPNPNCPSAYSDSIDNVIDWMKHYGIKASDGSTTYCTWGVDQASNATPQCDSNGVALLSRPLQTGEIYVPAH